MAVFSVQQKNIEQQDSTHRLVYKRIESFFMPYTCYRTMTRINLSILAQHEYFFTNRPEQSFRIPAGQICSPNAFIEKNISCDRKFFLDRIKRYAAGTNLTVSPSLRNADGSGEGSGLMPQI